MEWIVNYRDIRVKEKLGSDRYSAVNKAEWNNKTIVVKRFKYDDFDYLDFADCLRVSNHENILKVYGYTVRIDDHFYLLMEYADCGSLHEQIHGTGVEKYTRDTALNWMYQCAKGIAFLHQLIQLPIIV
ncbi:hypothetical protein ACLKA6_018445 [Drosophila palustris]